MSLAIKTARSVSQGGLSGNVESGGFLDFLGGVARTGLALVTGGPTAALSTGIRQLRGGGGNVRPPPRSLTGGLPILVSGPGTSLALPGGGGKPGRGVAVSPAGSLIACPSGTHPNKSSYHTRAGFVPKGSRCVTNRRSNPMNARALDRAIRRVDSGKRLQSKLATITTAKYTAGGARKAHTHS